MAPDEHVDALSEVPRRGTYEWVFSRDRQPTETGERRLYPLVDVVAGSYAVAVDGWLGDAETPDAGRTAFELIARVEVRPVEPAEATTDSA